MLLPQRPLNDLLLVAHERDAPPQIREAELLPAAAATLVPRRRNLRIDHRDVAACQWPVCARRPRNWRAIASRYVCREGIEGVGLVVGHMDPYYAEVRDVRVDEVDARLIAVDGEARDRAFEVKREGVSRGEGLTGTSNFTCPVGFSPLGPLVALISKMMKLWSAVVAVAGPLERVTESSCVGGGGGGAALETLGKAKAVPMIAMVSTGFSFMIPPLAPGPLRSRHTTRETRGQGGESEPVGGSKHPGNAFRYMRREQLRP